MSKHVFACTNESFCDKIDRYKFSQSHTHYYTPSSNQFHTHACSEINALDARVNQVEFDRQAQYSRRCGYCITPSCLCLQHVYKAVTSTSAPFLRS